MTILELFADTILKTFRVLQKAGCMTFWKIDDYMNDFFEKIITGGMVNALKNITLMN